MIHLVTEKTLFLSSNIGHLGYSDNLSHWLVDRYIKLMYADYTTYLVEDVPSYIKDAIQLYIDTKIGNKNLKIKRFFTEGKRDGNMCDETLHCIIKNNLSKKEYDLGSSYIYWFDGVSFYHLKQYAENKERTVHNMDDYSEIEYSTYHCFIDRCLNDLLKNIEAFCNSNYTKYKSYILKSDERYKLSFNNAMNDEVTDCLINYCKRFMHEDCDVALPESLKKLIDTSFKYRLRGGLKIKGLGLRSITSMIFGSTIEMYIKVEDNFDGKVKAWIKEYKVQVYSLKVAELYGLDFESDIDFDSDIVQLKIRQLFYNLLLNLLCELKRGDIKKLYK